MKRKRTEPVILPSFAELTSSIARSASRSSSSPLIMGSGGVPRPPTSHEQPPLLPLTEGEPPTKRRKTDHNTGVNNSLMNGFKQPSKRGEKKKRGKGRLLFTDVYEFDFDENLEEILGSVTDLQNAIKKEIYNEFLKLLEITKEERKQSKEEGNNVNKFAANFNQFEDREYLDFSHVEELKELQDEVLDFNLQMRNIYSKLRKGVSTTARHQQIIKSLYPNSCFWQEISRKLGLIEVKESRPKKNKGKKAGYKLLTSRIYGFNFDVVLQNTLRPIASRQDYQDIFKRSARYFSKKLSSKTEENEVGHNIVDDLLKYGVDKQSLQKIEDAIKKFDKDLKKVFRNIRAGRALKKNMLYTINHHYPGSIFWGEVKRLVGLCAVNKKWNRQAQKYLEVAKPPPIVQSVVGNRNGIFNSCGSPALERENQSRDDFESQRNGL